MRLRHVAELNPAVRGLSRADAGREISFLPLDRIWSDERFNPSETVEFSGDLASYNPVAEGDILLPKVSPTFTQGRVVVARGLANSRALATSEVFVIRASRCVEARFLAYRLRAADFLKEGEASWTGVAGLKRVSSEFVRDVRIDRGAWEDGPRVADFLDRECERIRTLVQLLDDVPPALQEGQRRSIDDLFAGPTTRLANVATVQTGLTLGGRFEGGEDLVERPYLRVANVQADAIVIEDLATVTVPSRVAQRTTLKPGDVLMTEGGDVDKLGRGAVWDGRISGCLHQNHVFAVRCGTRMEPDVLAVWTRGSEARRYFEGTASRITNIASTNLTKLLRLPVPALPVEEQVVLLREFEKQNARLARVRFELAELRTGLTEYRDALITEAVTGRLDVARLSEPQLDESAHAAVEGERPEVLSA